MTPEKKELSRAERKKLANDKRRIIRDRLVEVFLAEENDQRSLFEKLWHDYTGEHHLIDQVLSQVDYALDVAEWKQYLGVE